MPFRIIIISVVSILHPGIIYICTQISSENKIIFKFPKFPNIPENYQYSHKIPSRNLPLLKFPGILHPYLSPSLFLEGSHV